MRILVGFTIPKSSTAGYSISVALLSLTKLNYTSKIISLPDLLGRKPRTGNEIIGKRMNAGAIKVADCLSFETITPHLSSY